MANSTKKTASGKKKTTAGNKKSSKKNNSVLFDSRHKQVANFVTVIVGVLLFAVAVIPAGGAWGALRNFTFGFSGIGAFIIPIFAAVWAVVSSIGKDDKKFVTKAIECIVVYILFVSLLNIITCDETHTYGERIADAYNIFKNYNGDGSHYGFGVIGALFGGIPLAITGGGKTAAIVISVLLLLAALFIFTGTTIAKIVHSLKKPAEAVGEYAGEKLDSFRESYETVAEDLHEKKARNAEKKAENEVKRRKIPDIILDEKEAAPDMGLESFLAEKGELGEVSEDSGEKPIELLDEFENSPEISAPPLDEILSLKEKRSASRASSKKAAEIVAEQPASEWSGEDGPHEVSSGMTVDELIPLQSEIDAGIVAGNEKAEQKPEYKLPPVDLLDAPKGSSRLNNENELREKGERIVKTLASFGVGTKIVDICCSPSVTRFELQPDPGVKISRITNLSDDIAMNLAASGVRIEAPIPNKNAVGIEVPNAEKAMVTLRELIDSKQFSEAKSKLTVALGRDIQGEVTCADLAKMPHLLVAGTTGSGKSVCLNTMIMSILFNAKPDEVKLILVDPKNVEFTVYKTIPHLLIPVVVNPRKAAGALSWAVAEMDKRYALFAERGVRNLQGYNNYAVNEGLEKIPQIVIIIDEFADLMMAASNEVEDSVCRLAQKARAAGMHLIVATQRPSVDVITGLIKANVPSRIALSVKSQIDSRTIIDTAGAEKLLGNGDMLFFPVGLSKPLRVQGAYVSDENIEDVVSFISAQSEVKYDDSVIQEIELKAAQENNKKKSSVDASDIASQGDGDDEMTMKAIEVVVEAGMASTTLLQRKLKLGYARAARIVDELSEKGIIGPFEGSKPRKVLITKEQWYQMQANASSNTPKQLSFEDVAEEESEGGSSGGSTGGGHHVQKEETNYFGSAKNTNYEVGEDYGPVR